MLLACTSSTRRTARCEEPDFGARAMTCICSDIDSLSQARHPFHKSQLLFDTQKSASSNVSQKFERACILRSLDNATSTVPSSYHQSRVWVCKAWVRDAVFPRARVLQEMALGTIRVMVRTLRASVIAGRSSGDAVCLPLVHLA